MNDTNQVRYRLTELRSALRADTLNYELCKRVTRKDKDTGKATEEWLPFNYFTLLESALNKIINLKVRASEAKTLAELKTDIEVARTDVCQAYNTGVGVNMVA